MERGGRELVKRGEKDKERKMNRQWVDVAKEGCERSSGEKKKKESERNRKREWREEVEIMEVSKERWKRDSGTERDKERETECTAWKRGMEKKLEERRGR